MRLFPADLPRVVLRRINRGTSSYGCPYFIGDICVRNAHRSAAEAFRVGHDQREVLTSQNSVKKLSEKGF